jgi:hypothetical protein
MDGSSVGDSVIAVGIAETLGTRDGKVEGTNEREGSLLGCVDRDGKNEGSTDGELDG